MSIFKKKDDYNDEEIERRIHSKSFRDLKPENRKRRKEPPKPWGKKERLLILSIILVTILLPTFLALSAREWKLPGLPRFSFEMPTFSFPSFGNETIVIEGNLQNDVQSVEKIKSEFKSAVKPLSGVYGLYVIRLGDGFAYGINEKEIFQAASLIKLPVIVTLYREAESGDIDIDTRYTLKASDKVGGAGVLQNKSVGTVLTYRELAFLMGSQSDNTAFNIVRRILGDENIEETIKTIGMNKTSLKENETTPYDIGVFFQKLFKGGIISEDSTSEILESLTNTIYEEHLVAGIPRDVRVAHKYGREVHVVNDAGIVFADKPFVVVIMSKGVVEKEADEIFPELSEIVFGFEGNRH